MRQDFCDICDKPAMSVRLWGMRYYVKELVETEDGLEEHIHRRSIALCPKCAELVDHAVSLWERRGRVFTKAQLNVIEKAAKEKSNDTD